MDTIDFTINFSLPSGTLDKAQRCFLDNSKLVYSAIQEVSPFPNPSVSFRITCQPAFLQIFYRQVYGTGLVKRLFIRNKIDKQHLIGMFSSYEECEKYLTFNSLSNLEFKWAELDINELSLTFEVVFSTSFEHTIAEIFKSTEGWQSIVTSKLWGIKDV